MAIARESRPLYPSTQRALGRTALTNLARLLDPPALRDIESGYTALFEDRDAWARRSHELADENVRLNELLDAPCTEATDLLFENEALLEVLFAKQDVINAQSERIMELTEIAGAS